MHSSIQHVYKLQNGRGGVLYAWFPSMYTRVDIILCQQKCEEELLLIVGEIYDTLQQLEKIGNYYDATSELYTVNQTASQHPVSISKELCTLIQICLEYHKRTLGCFDITIQSDNYGKETHHSLLLSAEKQCIAYKQAGTRMDFSGILKGYALERVREVLHKHQIEDALINMGNSSILALGNHPHGKGWRVGFGAQLTAVIADSGDGILLHNQCLTVSGNETSERRHIISPLSGEMIEGARCLAVVTDSGVVGEILSTSLFVANASQRKSLIKEFHIKDIYDL